MADWWDRLRNGLEKSGKTVHTWRTADGELMVLDHSARIVACRLGEGGENLFWHNTALEDTATAGEALEAGGGAIGGDRFWIAPEIAYMWTDLEAARKDPADSNVLDPQMDPGQWQTDEVGDSRLVLTNQMRLTDHRSGLKIALEARREFSLISPPQDLPSEISSISFAIRNDLRLLEGSEGAVAGGWDLLQVPPKGTLICPTVTRVNEPRSYYDPFGKKHVQCDDQRVRFLIDGRRKVKMGLLPEHVTGRMGYYRPLDREMSSLILRIYPALPGEPYIDLPRSSDAIFGGDILQAYNDDGAFGGFGEMEYHDAALVAGCGTSSRSGTCVTHVILGPDDEVREAGERLLGVSIDMIA